MLWVRGTWAATKMQSASTDLKTTRPEAHDTGQPPEKVTSDTGGRRRPGRNENVAPGLIPLLRAPEPESYDEDMEDADDPMGALKGIMLLCMLCLPFWAGFAMAVMFVRS